MLSSSTTKTEIEKEFEGLGLEIEKEFEWCDIEGKPVHGYSKYNKKITPQQKEQLEDSARQTQRLRKFLPGLMLRLGILGVAIFFCISSQFQTLRRLTNEGFQYDIDIDTSINININNRNMTQQQLPSSESFMALPEQIIQQEEKVPNTAKLGWSNLLGRIREESILSKTTATRNRQQSSGWNNLLGRIRKEQSKSTTTTAAATNNNNINHQNSDDHDSDDQVIRTRRVGTAANTNAFAKFYRSNTPPQFTTHAATHTRSVGAAANQGYRKRFLRNPIPVASQTH